MVESGEEAEKNLGKSIHSCAHSSSPFTTHLSCSMDQTRHLLLLPAVLLRMGYWHTEQWGGRSLWFVHAVPLPGMPCLLSLSAWQVPKHCLGTTFSPEPRFAPCHLTPKPLCLTTTEETRWFEKQKKGGDMTHVRGHMAHVIHIYKPGDHLLNCRPHSSARKNLFISLGGNLSWGMNKHNAMCCPLTLANREGVKT